MSYELTPENIAIEFGEHTGRKDSLQLQIERLLKETIDRETEQGYFSTVIADAEVAAKSDLLREVKAHVATMYGSASLTPDRTTAIYDSGWMAALRRLESFLATLD